MNKINKLLWGILSLGISLIYRTNVDAAHYTDTNAITNPAVGDTITIGCDFGNIVLSLVYAFNHAANTTSDIPREENCVYLDEYICNTTATYTSMCNSFNHTAIPKHSSAVNPSDFTCSTLTCPNGGTLGQRAVLQTETLNLTKNSNCHRYYTGGTGHRYIGFSFVISAITASSGWYGSYSKFNGTKDWIYQQYSIYWQRVNNNSINDCYLAPGTYTDSNGNTYTQTDSDNKCYYQE